MALFALALVGITAPAFADLGVSINVGEPGSCDCNPNPTIRAAAGEHLALDHTYDLPAGATPFAASMSTTPTRRPSDLS